MRDASECCPDGTVHEWEVQDDSFVHEFGTEVIVYEMCVNCQATRSYESPESEGDD